MSKFKKFCEKASEYLFIGGFMIVAMAVVVFLAAVFWFLLVSFWTVIIVIMTFIIIPGILFLLITENPR